LPSICTKIEDNVAELQYIKDALGHVLPLADAAERVVKVDISTSPRMRREVLQKVSRMNVSHSTLSPGL